MDVTFVRLVLVICCCAGTHAVPIYSNAINTTAATSYHDTTSTIAIDDIISFGVTESYIGAITTPATHFTEPPTVMPFSSTTILAPSTEPIFAENNTFVGSATNVDTITTNVDTITIVGKNIQISAATTISGLSGGGSTTFETTTLETTTNMVNVKPSTSAQVPHLAIATFTPELTHITDTTEAVATMEPTTVPVQFTTDSATFTQMSTSNESRSQIITAPSADVPNMETATSTLELATETIMVENTGPTGHTTTSTRMTPVVTTTSNTRTIMAISQTLSGLQTNTDVITAIMEGTPIMEQGATTVAIIEPTTSTAGLSTTEKPSSIQPLQTTVQSLPSGVATGSGTGGTTTHTATPESPVPPAAPPEPNYSDCSQPWPQCNLTSDDAAAISTVLANISHVFPTSSVDENLAEGFSNSTSAAVNCSAGGLSTPLNGQKTCNSLSDMVFCDIGCNQGYDFTEDPSTFLCDQDNGWQPKPSAPDCSFQHYARYVYDLVGNFTINPSNSSNNCTESFENTKKKKVPTATLR